MSTELYCNVAKFRKAVACLNMLESKYEEFTMLFFTVNFKKSKQHSTLKGQ
jgi:hypothetical protein